MVCFLSGPTETTLIGISNSFSKKCDVVHSTLLETDFDQSFALNLLSNKEISNILELHFLAQYYKVNV